MIYYIEQVSTWIYRLRRILAYHKKIFSKRIIKLTATNISHRIKCPQHFSILTFSESLYCSACPMWLVSVAMLPFQAFQHINRTPWNGIKTAKQDNIPEACLNKTSQCPFIYSNAWPRDGRLHVTPVFRFFHFYVVFFFCRYCIKIFPKCPLN